MSINMWLTLSTRKLGIGLLKPEMKGTSSLNRKRFIRGQNKNVDHTQHYPMTVIKLYKT
jgi:hypothetical protein